MFHRIRLLQRWEACFVALSHKVRFEALHISTISEDSGLIQKDVLTLCALRVHLGLFSKIQQNSIQNLHGMTQTLQSPMSMTKNISSRNESTKHVDR